MRRKQDSTLVVREGRADGRGAETWLRTALRASSGDGDPSSGRPPRAGAPEPLARGLGPLALPARRVQVRFRIGTGHGSSLEAGCAALRGAVAPSRETWLRTALRASSGDGDP